MGRKIRESKKPSPPRLKIDRNPRNDGTTRKVLARFLWASRRLSCRVDSDTSLYDQHRQTLINNLEGCGPFEPWARPQHILMRVTQKDGIIIIERFRRRHGSRSSETLHGSDSVRALPEPSVGGE
jgi:hypothetical protein